MLSASVSAATGRHVAKPFLCTDSRWHPDPMRAHGAWIFLSAATAAGALVGAERGVEPAMLAGTGFAGAYLIVAAIDAGAARRKRQILLGAMLSVLAPLGALWLGAEPQFLFVAALAVLPASAVVALVRTHGSLSPATLITGVAAVTLAAPLAALAGGASVARAVILFLLLLPFFSWRTLLVAADLPRLGPWDREVLRRQGLREAAISAIWTLVIAIAIRAY